MEVFSPAETALEFNTRPHLDDLAAFNGDGAIGENAALLVHREDGARAEEPAGGRGGKSRTRQRQAK